MRWFVGELFKENYLEISKNQNISNIAVIGGYISDIEIQSIIEITPSAKIKYFGIDNNPEIEYLDINLTNPSVLSEEFDLVISSQVIEHIWNLSNFFTIIDKITKKNGYVWLSCPFSNIAHGSPEYYAAGYTPEFLVNNFKAGEWTPVVVTQIGSKRNYVSTHLYATWLSKEELFHPIRGYHFKPGSLQGVIWKWMREFPGKLHLSLLNNEIDSKSRWATESVVMLKKST